MSDKPKEAADAPKEPSEQERTDQDYAEQGEREPLPGSSPHEDTGAHP